MWVSGDDFYDLTRDVRGLKDFVRWPSIDDNNGPLRDWIESIAGEVFQNERKKALKDDSRDILLALVDYLGLEYNHNKIVIQKKKGKR